MQRSELKRATPLRRYTPMGRRVGPKQVNKKRKAKRFARDFGEQSDFVRTQPCCVCLHECRAQTSPTEVHHEPPRSCGGRDRDTLPLCTEHHRRRHDIGVSSFWEQSGVHWRDVRNKMHNREALSDGNEDDLPVSPLLAWLGE